MTEQHPITPPEELVDQWSREWFSAKVKHYRQEHFIAIEAARWGADQELEACCEWVEDNFDHCNSTDRSHLLRAARRPKPPSLKEQALEELEKWRVVIGVPHFNNIRRALEQLDD